MKTGRLTTIAAIVVPPLVSFIKDILATMATLSTEPGITANTAHYYRVAMLPGTLWFGGGTAILFNVGVGLLIGLFLFLWLTRNRLWLVMIIAGGFFLKDVIATAVLALSTAPGTAPAPSLYYAIALLPGSALEKYGDPIVFNLLVGTILGLVLYLLASKGPITKRQTV